MKIVFTIWIYQAEKQQLIGQWLILTTTKKKERNKNTHLFYPGTQVLSLGNSVFQLFLSFVPDWQKIEISGPKKEIAVEKKERRDITEKWKTYFNKEELSKGEKI